MLFGADDSIQALTNGRSTVSDVISSAELLRSVGSIATRVRELLLFWEYTDRCAAEATETSHKPSSNDKPGERTKLSTRKDTHSIVLSSKRESHQAVVIDSFRQLERLEEEIRQWTPDQEDREYKKWFEENSSQLGAPPRRLKELLKPGLNSELFVPKILEIVNTLADPRHYRAWASESESVESFLEFRDKNLLYFEDHIGRQSVFLLSECSTFQTMHAMIVSCHVTVSDVQGLDDHLQQYAKTLILARRYDITTTAGEILNASNWETTVRPQLNLQLRLDLGPPGTLLYVNGIHPRFSPKLFRSLFESYGTVERSQIMCDATRERSLGYGFVNMSIAEEAEMAKDGLHLFSIGNHTLRVQSLILDGHRLRWPESK